MKKLSSILITFFVAIAANAQMTMDVGTQSSNWGSTSSVNVVDPATIGIKKVDLLNYSDITGSPFYNPKWTRAILYLKNGKLLKLDQVRLNMFSNEVDYININKVEMVLEAYHFKKIVLMKQDDSTHIAAVFECYPDMVDNAKGEAFYRQINEGTVHLLALDKAILKTGTYDPLLGKEPKSFYSKKFYGISNVNVFSPLKVLDRNTILPILRSHQDDEDWLNTKRNKLRNESDVTSFFEYYNSKKN